MIKVLLFVLWLANSHDVYSIHAIQIDDLEIERELQVINKPSVKSIQTDFGYIVDCVDIYKQSAFDHPLLKDHKLQRKPIFLNSFEKTTTKNSSNEFTFGLQKEKCPIGTVPIRRISKDDIIEGKSSFYNQSLSQEFLGAHFAEVYLKSNHGPYYKVTGSNSIYNPKVSRDQTSISHIWVENGPVESTNKITFGWHVAPKVYGGNTATAIYSSWTRDNYKKTGCYNLQCSGFVQIHREKYLGAFVPRTSVGGTIIEYTFSINQDPKTKNWWLNLQRKDDKWVNIGYYPAKLFWNMSSADQVGWGGRTVTLSGTPSPEMGSGYFPDPNFGRACYFRSVSFQNGKRTDLGPQKDMVSKFVDRSICFNAEFYGHGRTHGYYLEFGGPGGKCGD